MDQYKVIKYVCLNVGITAYCHENYTFCHFSVPNKNSYAIHALDCSKINDLYLVNFENIVRKNVRRMDIPMPLCFNTM